jgi:hypothetical protein
MKISRLLAVFMSCTLIGFFASGIGCTGGSGQFILPDEQAQIDEALTTGSDSPVSAAPVSETPGEITAPEVVAVTAQVEVAEKTPSEGEEKIDKGLPCILNYVPDEADVTAYMSSGAEAMLDKLGLGKLKDDEELMREAFFYLESAVLFGKSDNEMKDQAVLMRLKSDIGGDFDGFIAKVLEKMNEDLQTEAQLDSDAIAADTKDKDSRPMRYQRLDDGTGIISKSDEVISDVLSRVESGAIPQDACVFYRVDRGAAVSTAPVAYAMAKGAAAVKLGESIFPNEIENLKQSLAQSMMIGGLNLDEGGKILMYVAMLDSDNAATAKAITYFSFFLDSDNALAADLLKLFSEKTLEGGFDDKEMKEMEEKLAALENQYDKLIVQRDDVMKMLEQAATDEERADLESKLSDIDSDIDRIAKEIEQLKRDMKQ